MNILFAGTPEFASTALAALLASSHSVLAVYTQPDRPAGRGRKYQASPVKQFAQAHGLPILQPETLRDAHEQTRLHDFAADVMVVAAYGLLLPKAVLRTPRLGCINLHASLLPSFRGAAPIQRAILAGDQETGISIMQMALRLDSGPILLQQTCPILSTDTATTLHDRLATLGASMIVGALDDLAQGMLSPKPQDEALATYATKLDKAEAGLNWSQSAQALDRQVRAFNPYPIAQTQTGQTIVRIWQASIDTHTTSATPGTILESNRNGISVATGDSTLILRTIQLPGARPLDVAEVLNAHAHLFQPGSVRR